MKVLARYFFCVVIGFVALNAQEKQTVRCKISYVAASVAYLDAGKEDQLAMGDTIHIYRKDKFIGNVIIIALSKHSSAAQSIGQTVSLAVGDAGVIEKGVYITKIKQDTSITRNAVMRKPSTQRQIINRSTDENIISGRVGIQYIGVSADDARFNIQQPSVITRLEMRNLFGTGMVFSMYGRNSYDLSKNISRFGNTNRLRNRMYEFQIHNDDPDAIFCYGAGRMTSRYVGGLGTFDGGHIFYRYGNFTSGVMAGATVEDLSYSVDENNTKGAVFLNYQYGTLLTNHYDITLAYGQKMSKGKLDREFLYLQNFLSLGNDFSLYENSEVELNDIHNGVRKKAFKLSNTFISANYYPLQWLSLNAGFDGSRSIYLFESMKAFPDTLFDRNFMQGYRGGVAVRLPYFISLSGNLYYRTKKGDARETKTSSATFRVADIFGSDVGASVRYADIMGIYSNGNNFTIDVDKTFFYRLSLTFRYDYYRYTLLTTSANYFTQTITISGNYRITQMLYTALNIDAVRESVMNSYRFFFEIGMRF